MCIRKNSFTLIGVLAALWIAAIPEARFAFSAPLEGGTLDPNSIPKYQESLLIPAVQPPVAQNADFTLYAIAAREFEQQVLPQPFPKTTVWGYGNAGGPPPGGADSTYHSPAFTIEVRKDERVFVDWINALVDRRLRFRPHLFAVDPTLYWANPPGPPDSRQIYTETPAPYIGPVPLVPHLYGGHSSALSDGHPEAWTLPLAVNIPSIYARRGSDYDSILPVSQGHALFRYDNDQRASTLWFHDHTLGITRLNVYAGLAGFYLIRDDEEDSLNLPGPAPRLGDPPGVKYYELPILIQDRSFNADGSLFYPASREFYDGFKGPFLPFTNVSPFWNPAFYANTMVVNGRTWPVLDVESRPYRFRLLNGCNSRFLILKLVKDPLARRPGTASLPFNQIGNDGGLLPGGPAVVKKLLMAPGERMDVIVDLSNLDVGSELYLINEGPDTAFKGMNLDDTLSDGKGGVLEASDPQTTGQVMKLRVVPLTGKGNLGHIPSGLPAISVLDQEIRTRDVTLNEMVAAFDAIAPFSSPFEGPVSALLGDAEAPSLWMDPIEENPSLGDTEIWRIINLSENALPIHLHLVHFEVLDRQPFDPARYVRDREAFLNGSSPNPPQPFFLEGTEAPEANEAGWKDTVIALPRIVTRIKAKFDRPGLYVWHTVLLEREDNEMMRPYEVKGPAEPLTPAIPEELSSLLKTLR